MARPPYRPLDEPSTSFFLDLVFIPILYGCSGYNGAVGSSKPRKHGLYTGGRPWPLVAPICRSCQGGAPDHFYNSRGLCNVCHKSSRKLGTKGLWPDLPSMLRESSLRQLQNNPLKWLRNNMSDSHAQTIPPHLYEVEAWRIIHVVACRWYGETVFLDPLKVTNWEDVVWSRSPDSESEDHAPIHDVDAAARHRRERAAAAKRARGRGDPLRRQHIIEIIKPMVIDLASKGIELPRPRVLITEQGWVASWNQPHGGFVVTGDLNSPPKTIGVQEDDDGLGFEEFSFNPDTLRLVWGIFKMAHEQTELFNPTV